MQYILGVLIGLGIVSYVVRRYNKKVDKGFIDEAVIEHNNQEKGWYRGKYNSSVREYTDFYADMDDATDNARKN